MRIRPNAGMARAAFVTTFVALATIMLDACGPDDGSAAARSASQTAPSPRDAVAAPSAGIRLPAASNADADADTSADANASALASDPVQSAQASLAADSQQVAPVMSYAPGDGAQQQASNGNGNGNGNGNDSNP
ncbi:hypothetical protein [Paraburkholderia sp. J41]|uniref:hypothetical protein n=1 Tax=Paraburkholderia sp. J41 TaxID=2805433 RepID=UPI002AC351DF|nr:hypothetical protein [Paraburkholderia sp. J41]